MVAHLLEDDLVLMVAGELSGPDLLHAYEHVRACGECRDRAAVQSACPGSEVSETFYEEVERIIALVETDRCPILKTIGRLQDIELTMDAASASLDGVSERHQHQRGRVLFCLSWLLQLNGSMVAARKTAIRAKEVFLALGDEFQVARSLTAEAAALGWLLETAAALCASAEAATIFSRLGDDRRARIARSAAATALEIADRPAQAGEIYQDPLVTTPSGHADRASWSANLAICLLACGELSRADEMAADVLATPDLLPQVYFGAVLTRAMAQARRGHLEDALRQLRQMAAEARASEMRYHEMLANYTMAEVLSALDHSEETAVVAKAVIGYLTEENIPSHARAAVALLREAVERRPAFLFDELEVFRATFPEVLRYVPRFGSPPSRLVS